MTHVNRMLSISTAISSISTSMTDTPRSRASSPERAAELCSNWWPDPSLANVKTIPGMPHPLCRICANWLPDIEDTVIPLNKTMFKNTKKSGCGNDWPSERNLIAPLLPTSLPILKEEPLTSTLNSLAARTDQKFN